MKLTGQPIVNKGMKPARIAKKTIRKAKPKNMAYESKESVKTPKMSQKVKVKEIVGPKIKGVKTK